jgi:predicted transcriptional regulator
MRDIMVHVRLNPKERENLEKLANIEGTSMAETARLLIRDAAMKMNSREKGATAR